MLEFSFLTHSGDASSRRTRIKRADDSLIPMPLNLFRFVS